MGAKKLSDKTKTLRVHIEIQDKIHSYLDELYTNIAAINQMSLQTSEQANCTLLNAYRSFVTNISSLIREGE